MFTVAGPAVPLCTYMAEEERRDLVAAERHIWEGGPKKTLQLLGPPYLTQ